jgi:hypothetical protein
MRRIISKAIVAGIALVAGLGLAACGTPAAAPPKPAVTVTAPASTAPALTPSQAFVRDANAAWPTGSMTGAQLVKFGHDICSDLGTGDSADVAAQTLVSGGVPKADATGVVQAAITDLCPDEAQ